MVTLSELIEWNLTNNEIMKFHETYVKEKFHEEFLNCISDVSEHRKVR